MKKSIYLSIAASLLIIASTSFANDEMPKSSAMTSKTNSTQINSTNKLNEAIKMRQRHYLRAKLRNVDHKNVKKQLMRHTVSRAEAGADGVSTFTDRTGALTNFDGRRPFTGSRVNAPNNSKRNFRTRAYDYYVEGGHAGTEVLENDVVLSSNLTPTRRRFPATNTANAEIINAVRLAQKNNSAPTAATTSNRRTTKVGGASSRNFIHPFMNIDLGN